MKLPTEFIKLEGVSKHVIDDPIKVNVQLCLALAQLQHQTIDESLYLYRFFLHFQFQCLTINIFFFIILFPLFLSGVTFKDELGVFEKTIHMFR